MADTSVDILHYFSLLGTFNYTSFKILEFHCFTLFFHKVGQLANQSKKHIGNVELANANVL